MVRKRNERVKPLQKLETSVTEILIADNGSLKPYIQTFRHEPENIALQPLGSVLGIFEIEDQSEDSAYIVNFLASIVKKEYFSHPRRPVIESLEATLHKINIALSELIKHDNTSWLGKLNAAICVLEKNNLHFSVSGKAKTLLIRNGILTDISDGLAEESELHPLKTFTEVSSGRLKVDDKIILTTPGLFEIFSPAEIQKSVQRFPKEKFSQFLKTALINQLVFGSTLIIDIFESTQENPIVRDERPLQETRSIANAFSQAAFSRPKTSADSDQAYSPVSQENSSQIKEEYMDSKTQHIYVQGDTPETPRNETWVRFQWLAEEYWTKTTESVYRVLNHSKKSIQLLLQEKTAKKSEQTQPQPLPDNTPPDTQEPIKHVIITEEAEEGKTPKKIIPSSIAMALLDFPKKIDARKYLSITQSALSRLLSLLQRVLPHISKIRTEFSKLSPRQKKYALFAVFSIVVFPLILIKIQSGSKEPAPPVETAPAIQMPQPLSQDKNVHRIETIQPIFSSGNNLLSVILLRENLFTITKDAVISLNDPQNSKSFALPKDLGNSILRATAMRDLNTIFLLTDTGKLVSFTPSNHAFTDNRIALPNTTDIAGISSYLTYLYVADSQNNAILRYPRADGGFGDGSSWLKETVDIADTGNDIAINEDLYLSQTDHVLAFNKGRRDPIAFESSATPVVFSKIFSQAGMSYIYVIDTANKRLIRFEKSGAIVDQYAHEKLGGVSTVTINEQSKKAYFTTASEVFAIDLE